MLVMQSGNFVGLPFQIHISGDLHGGDDHQKYSKGLHPQQIHLPAEPLELARFRCDHEWLRHDWHGGGEFGWFENFSRT